MQSRAKFCVWKELWKMLKCPEFCDYCKVLSWDGSFLNAKTEDLFFFSLQLKLGQILAVCSCIYTSCPEFYCLKNGNPNIYKTKKTTINISKRFCFTITKKSKDWVVSRRIWGQHLIKWQVLWFVLLPLFFFLK